MDIRIIKNSLREEFRARRNALSAEEKSVRDDKIADVFLKSLTYKYASQILLYVSTDEEISTRRIINTAIADGKKVFAPHCFEDARMEYFRIDGPDSLEDGQFGIKAPPVDAETYSPQPSDVCIVPAMSYDKEGFRLGYGKGFYDRFLPKFLGVKIGFCYNDFMSAKLPRGRFDVAVDMIITEKGVTVL